MTADYNEIRTDRDGLNEPLSKGAFLYEPENIDGR